ncbi:hypothetical protein [Pseudonocardia sp. HH130629-09]|uniref:hypothetical protein n=1 Tax=Pseudonocardia sp. HH130629-09 TaxID=1641402 RepID=UPI0011AEA90A|nr:hypothetical protein [Pseudonocardia sp. HH130629-09]
MAGPRKVSFWNASMNSAANCSRATQAGNGRPVGSWAHGACDSDDRVRNTLWPVPRCSIESKPAAAASSMWTAGGR